jgi:transposase
MSWRRTSSPAIRSATSEPPSFFLRPATTLKDLRSEASFASLCGISPVPASSGKTVRHRLNRGGDRAANSALRIIAIGRLRTDRENQGLRCWSDRRRAFQTRRHWSLERYLAREVFTLMTQRRKEINATRIAA